MAVALAALMGAGIFAWQFAAEVELRHFYVWDFLAVWFWEALLVAGCYGLGRPVLALLLPAANLGRGERTLFTMTLGVIAWVLLFFLAGPLGLYRSWFAICVPVLGLAFLVQPLRARARQGKEALTWAPVSLSPLEVMLAVFAVWGLTLVYLPLLSADSVATDAAWFHLSAAEDYAREGAMVPLPGDYAKCIPQLTSILHLYAFLVPGLPETQRWVLALHTEFALFVWTLFGINQAVAYLLPGPKIGRAFGAFFLFPALFIYDSNLGGAADHIIAFFVLPQLLAAFRAIETKDRRLALLSGLFAGAALLTKLQAAYVIVPLSVLFGADLLMSLVKDRKGWRSAVLLGALYVVGACAVFSPQLIKNWVFYHNPMYPMMMDVFDSRPSYPDAAQIFTEHYPPLEHPEFWPHLRASMETALTYPFSQVSPHRPHRPYLGALFVLLTPVALLTRSPRQLKMLWVAWGAIFYWAFAFPAGRNMQTFFPIMVTVVAVSAHRAWHAGWLGRLAIGALVFFQLVTSFDYVIMSNDGKINDAFRLINSGTRAGAATRYVNYRASFRGIRDKVPEDGVVLLHTAYSQLGIRRRIVLDWPGFQGLIDYRPAKTPRGIYEELREHGISHVVTDPAWPAHSRQEDVLFSSLLVQYGKQLGKSHHLQIWELPKEPPPREEAYEVLIWGIARYADGLYRVEHLDQLDDGPNLPRDPVAPFQTEAEGKELIERASGAVVGKTTALEPDTQAVLRSRLQRLVSYPQYQVFARRRPDPTP